MIKYYRSKNILRIVALILILSGCTGKSAPTKFYMMGEGETSVTSYAFDPKDGGPLIGVGPVEIPAYLDRPQIVTRMGQNSVNLAEFDNWVEPLEETFLRLTLGMLVTQLSPEGMGVYPWKGSMETDYQVTLTVIRLDNNSKGDALLSVRWSIIKPDRQLITTQISNYDSPYTPQDFGSFAAAQTRNLEYLCRDIANILKKHQN
jgi:uncharacterized lipoprotein YmbA